MLEKGALFDLCQTKYIPRITKSISETTQTSQHLLVIIFFRKQNARKIMC